MPTKKNLHAYKAVGFKGAFALHQAAGLALCLAAAGTVRALEFVSAALGNR